MKKVIVLCNLDGYANAVRPNQIKSFLTSARKDFDVEVYSTERISRLANTGIKRFLPAQNIYSLKLFILEGCYSLATRAPSNLAKVVQSRIIKVIIKARGALLTKLLAQKQYDLLVCESNFDQAIMQSRVAKVQILDITSPLAEEMYYGREITETAFNELKAYEITNYQKADYISFPWHTYTDFVKANKYHGSNFTNIGWGVKPKTVRAKFSDNPKIIFLGFLGGYWVNLPLLEKLCSLNPNLDVYGGPDLKNPKINYKGYAPSLDVLAEYQFGLVTISTDPLRKVAFSSKQLEYFSYGLPVFAPDWKKDDLLKAGTIEYNENNFLSLIKQFSDEKMWQQKSDSALAIANQLTWEKALQPLLDIASR